MPGLALQTLTHEKRDQQSIHTSPVFLDKSLALFGGERIAAAIRRSVDQATARDWTVYESGLIHIMHAFTARAQCLLALTKVPLVESLVQGAIKLWHANDYRSVTFWVATSAIIRSVSSMYESCVELTTLEQKRGEHG